MIRIDMHVHSTASDGTISPHDLPAAARRAGVSIMALTDHDTVDGVPSFKRACAKSGVRGIAGIELSADAPFTTHILGYRLRDLSVINEATEWIVRKRNERNAAIVEKLIESGVDITLDDVEHAAKGRVVARPHFAAVLQEKGYVSNTREAFDKYLSKGRPGYVKREAYDAERCIDIIKSAGGVAALAHPSLTGLEGEELDELLSRLQGFGLWGIECFSSHCSNEDALNFCRHADKHNLCATAGSDFHGSNRPNVSLGVLVSEGFLPWARLGFDL